MNIQKSIELFTKANTLLPGGVDSPARAFRAVGGQPLFIDRGEGAYLVDVDGNRFVDYMLSFGPLIRGHAHPEVVAAIRETAAAVGIPIQQTHVGTMLCTFFTNQPVTNWESVSKSDTGRFATFFQALLTNGVYLPPSQFEAWFLSTEHREKELSLTISAVEKAFHAVKIG